MPFITSDLFKVWRHLPTPWANDENRFAALYTYHLYRGNKISVVRYYSGGFKSIFPSIIKQMGR